MSTATKTKREVLLSQLPEHSRIDQVASVLNCSDDAVRNLIDEGALTAIHIGTARAARKHLRVTRASVNEFIQKRIVTP